MVELFIQILQRIILITLTWMETMQVLVLQYSKQEIMIHTLIMLYSELTGQILVRYQ